jgi:hypothetical protein
MALSIADAETRATPLDRRPFYSEGTVEALNQFSLHTRFTPTDSLDLRCEFDVPRFADLLATNKPIFTAEEERLNFNWFHTQHDFNTPSDPKLESYLRRKILSLSKFPSENSRPNKKRESSGKLVVKSSRSRDPVP